MEHILPHDPVFPASVYSNQSPRSRATLSAGRRADGYSGKRFLCPPACLQLRELIANLPLLDNLLQGATDELPKMMVDGL